MLHSKGSSETAVLKVLLTSKLKDGLSGIEAQREGFNFISNVVEPEFKSSLLSWWQ